MSLRKPPTLTPALRAANRANSMKSTGPRTVPGRARVALNALSRGTRTKVLRQKLLATGSRQDVRLLDWIEACMRERFESVSARDKRMLTAAAQRVWCLLRGRDARGEGARWEADPVVPQLGPAYPPALRRSLTVDRPVALTSKAGMLGFCNNFR